MDRKNLIRGAGLLGLLVLILVGMVVMQPDKRGPNYETAYELKGFPALPSSQ